MTSGPVSAALATTAVATAGMTGSGARGAGVGGSGTGVTVGGGATCLGGIGVGARRNSRPAGTATTSRIGGRRRRVRAAAPAGDRAVLTSPRTDAAMMPVASASTNVHLSQSLRAVALPADVASRWPAGLAGAVRCLFGVAAGLTVFWAALTLWVTTFFFFASFTRAFGLFRTTGATRRGVAAGLLVGCGDGAGVGVDRCDGGLGVECCFGGGFAGGCF